MKKNHKFIVVLLALGIVALSVSVTVAATSPQQGKVNIIVKFHPGVSETVQENLFKRFAADHTGSLFDGKVHILSVAEEAAEKVVDALSKNKQVEFAELDVLHELHAAPDDPLIGNQWYIQKINAQTVLSIQLVGFINNYPNDKPVR